MFELIVSYNPSDPETYETICRQVGRQPYNSELASDTRTLRFEYSFMSWAQSGKKRLRSFAGITSIIKEIV